MCPSDETHTHSGRAQSDQPGQGRSNQGNGRGNRGRGRGKGKPGNARESQDVPQAPASASFHPLTSEEFVDTHTHLHWTIDRISQYKGLTPAEAVNRFRHDYFPKNFHACINVLCDVLSFTSLTNEWMNLVGSCDFIETVAQDLLLVASHPRALAFGEIGLDYNRNLSPPETQKEVFTAQLQLALSVDKPIILHTRDAEDDTLSILKSIVPQNHIIHVHCFTGTASFVTAMLEHFCNAYFGFTGVVTYDNSAQELQAVVRDVVPLDRLLLETDSPYMPPNVPGQKRGKFSGCGDIPSVARKVGELKGLEVDVVMRAARENTRKVYGI
ncbi:putative deoxyribonuclease tatdn2 [Rhizophlyctis rosea]|nr:putative deoxyribonuclease tatdn2 [Rhizophlyctis rosea]